MESPLIRPLLDLCRHVDVEVSRLALGAVANCAEDPQTHSNLVETFHAMHNLVFLMKSKHLSIHREASRAVSNLLTSIGTHTYFLAEEGLRALMHVTRSLDIECQYNAALCFRKLSPNSANHELMIAQGCLQPMIGLSQVHDFTTQRQAAAALRDLASNHEFKVVFAQEGGLRATVSIAREEDLQLQVLQRLSLCTIIYVCRFWPLGSCVIFPFIAVSNVLLSKKVH